MDHKFIRQPSGQSNLLTSCYGAFLWSFAITDTKLIFLFISVGNAQLFPYIKELNAPNSNESSSLSFTIRGLLELSYGRRATGNLLNMFILVIDRQA